MGMLHQQVRTARQLAGLSRDELARRSGVPRSQIQKIEEGANVTLDTLMRIAEHLPNLGVVTAGPLHLQFQADAGELRRALVDFMASTAHLLKVLDGNRPTAPAPPQALAPDPPYSEQQLAAAARAVDTEIEEAIRLNHRVEGKKDAS